MSDPERELRQLWTEAGVSGARQDALIADVKAKARPGVKVGPFTIPIRGPQDEAERGG